MNYRHGFHAGNHADVLKHAALLTLVNHMSLKAKPFFMLDTHAGGGQYDLSCEDALRSGEFRFGIARLMAGSALPARLARYVDAVRAINSLGALDSYPGSPLLAARALRPSDRLIACELHAGQAAALAAVLAPFPKARAVPRDGYAALKTLLPPTEGRGLILIDPPFEQPNEFDMLGRAVLSAWRRWPEGQMLVWYPLKDRPAADAFLAAIAAGGVRDATHYELFVRDPALGGGMAGSGLLAVNASATLDPAMREVLPFLARRLAQGPGARSQMKRLTSA